MTPFDIIEPDGPVEGGEGCMEGESLDADGTGGLALDGSDMGAMPLPGDAPSVDGVVGADGTLAPATHDAEIAPSPEDVAQARQELVGGDGSVASTPATGAPVPDGGTQVAAQPATAEPQPAAPATPGQPADAAQDPTKAEAEAELAQANESAETAQLLSNIAKVRHDTAMGIIGNIR